ncbi:MAG: DUF2905 domain-containing protein [Candidatus Sericytochromatia bacterium]|nr:DUF2905 domain-containing protein [Candidatus Sericytochromatia bacterium]
MVAGGLLAVMGILVWIFGQVTGLTKLPGDFVWRRGNVTVYLPLATSIVLSLLLTLVLNLIFRQR